MIRNQPKLPEWAAKREATTESTLRRKIEGFRTNGMESLSSTEKARRKQQPPTIRRLIVDLKGEYHAFNTNEIANIVHGCPGRKPDVRSVRRVLDEEPLPLRILREYPRYRDGRLSVAEGCDRGVAPLRLEREGHSRLSGHPPLHCLQDR
jgi:hypothetical protein